MLLPLIAICLFSSCTKSITQTDVVDETALSAVMASKDYNQLKVNYALLKPSEKLEIWNRHIEYFIQSHDLSSEQLAFVHDFKKSWLVRNIFEENSIALKNFTLALPQIKYKAQSLLGVPDAFSLLIDLPSDQGYYGYSATTVQAKTNGVRTNDVTPPPPDNDCHCSRSDSYCNARSCRDNGCKSSSAGCGTLFLFSCNGVCSLL